ncbi:PQQ-like beta-propeller repeat protein [Sphingobacterium sp. SGR-19]|uniref:PQQ-like beta-propeller repeat protein n=1 Tax=Sphingobacterium sp. SGR-19 TaxID=2710886 RepID=UPI0013EE1E74|nr:PQQ-like beta-propeller repeat protein [Sphingobacterium sp. SGR-19]NGM64885.1 PQQ-like beta-propeller repeat protein [Sphingobacterium sp. SGR-19]
MRNTIIITILLFVAIVGASLYYFANLEGEKKETLRPLTFLPKETFLVATFQNDATTDNIFKDFEIFEAMVGRQEFEQWQTLKTKLLRHSTIQPYVNGVDQYVSFHPEKEAIATLFTIPTSMRIDAEAIDLFLEKAASIYIVTQKDTLENRIYSLDKGVKDSIFHIVYYKDIFFASYSESLLYQVMDRRAPKLGKDEIDYFIENNSRNSPLSVYFVHEQIPRIAEHLMRRNAGNFIKLFDNLGGQSAWNLSFKNDALILSGESETAHRKENYIELFGNQHKTSQTLYNYFPQNTASYLSFAISDTDSFRKDLLALLKQRGELPQLQAQFAEIKKSKDVSFEEDIHPIFGHEFALVEQSNQTELAFISVADSTKLDAFISSIATRVSDSLYRFNHSNIPYALYGDPLKSFTRPYFLRVRNILVLANYQSLLVEYRRDWGRVNLLTNTLGFKNSERIQGNEANITCFIRTSASSSMISNLLKASHRESFRDKNNFGYQDFYSWSIQIAGNNGNFQSSIYGVYKSKNALGAAADWVYEFNNRPITAPQVFEHSDTSQFILIQEQDHSVHAISPSGNKLWSTVFHGRIVGEAQQLDDRSIVLVTDRNRLYRFDPEGNSLPSFSLGMDSEPTYTPTISNIGGEQLIFIPAGRKLLVYTVDGEKVESWGDMNLAGKILFDIKVYNNQVFLGTENGHFYQFDAQGNLLKEEIIGDSQFKNPIAIVQLEQNRHAVYAVDTAQISLTMDFVEEPKTYKLEQGGNRSLISYFPSTDGAAYRMAMLNQKHLLIKNIQDSSALFDFTFTQEITDRPQYFADGSNSYSLGIASRKNYLVYLFDEKGSLRDGFPIEALPDFYYGKIDYNSATYLLCVRRDRKLYAFKH